MPKDPWYTLVQQAITKLDSAIAEAVEDGMPTVELELTESRSDLQACLAEYGPR